MSCFSPSLSLPLHLARARALSLSFSLSLSRSLLCTRFLSLVSIFLSQCVFAMPVCMYVDVCVYMCTLSLSTPSPLHLPSSPLAFSFWGAGAGVASMKQQPKVCTKHRRSSTNSNNGAKGERHSRSRQTPCNLNHTP